MFLRVGLQAENNVLDRMCYHFIGLKGVKMADLASLNIRFELYREQANIIIELSRNSLLSSTTHPC